MLTVNFLATNNFKTTYDNLNNDTTIDNLKIRFYRDHSDKLPTPSQVFIENEDFKSSEDNNDKDKDGDIQIVEREEEINNHYYKKAHSTIIHSHQIRFIFSGKQLENFSTLEENKIIDGSTILVAVSPFLVDVEKQFIQHQQEKDKQKQTQQEEKTTSDTIFVGIQEVYGTTKTERVKFKLSVNDRSLNTTSLNQQLNIQPLEPLGDQETYSLLSRISDFKDDNDTKKPLVSKPIVNLIPTNVKITESTEYESSGSLESLLDRVSLYDIPTKDDNIIQKHDEDAMEISKLTTDSSTRKIQIIKPKLKIISSSPNGDVSYATSITIMFNRPFLPLVNDVSNNYELPIKVEPEIPGAKWQSLDGIVFQYRLPSAIPTEVGSYGGSFASPTLLPLSTTYFVEVDTVMFYKLYEEEIDDLNFTFTTSPQSLKFWSFNNNLNDNPQIKINFAQSVKFNTSNPASLFKVYLLSQSQARQFEDSIKSPVMCAAMGIKELKFEIIKSTDEKCHWKKEMEPNTDKIQEKTVCLKINPNQLLACDMVIGIFVSLKDIGSTEGPNYNKSYNSYQFIKCATPPILNIVAELLSANSHAAPTQVSFLSNNNIDTKSFNTFFASNEAPKDWITKHVTVKPGVDISRVSIIGRNIRIYGQFRNSHIYTVSLHNISDVYKQTVSKVNGVFSFDPVPVKIWSLPGIISSPNNYYNLDSNSPPIFKVNSSGTSKLIIKAFTVNEQTLQKSTKINGSMSVDVVNKIDKNGEIEIINSTTLDLSSFFGGRNVSSCKHQLLIFSISSNQSLVNIFGIKSQPVEVFYLLQYTSINVSSLETGNSIVLSITDTLTKEYIKESQLTIYDKSNKEQVKTEHSVSKGLQILEKSVNGSHMIVTSGKNKCLYEVRTVKKSTKQDSHYNCFIFTDRGIYRPGDTVKVSGTIRLLTDDGVVIPNEEYLSRNLELYESNELAQVSYVLNDAKKKELLKGSVQLDQEFGVFQIDIKELPLDMDLGSTDLKITFNKREFSFDDIKVQEFKLKTFMNYMDLTTNCTDGSFELDTPFSIELFSKSYTDEIIPQTMVDWTITVTTQPPNYSKLDNNYSFRPFEDGQGSSVNSFKYSSKRKQSGKHYLDMVLQECNQRCIVRVQAIVSDLTNNQEEISKNFIVENPNPKWFGVLKSNLTTHLINVGDDFITEFMVSDFKSNPSTDGKIEVLIEKVPYEEDLKPENVYSTMIVPQQDLSLNKFSYQFRDNGYYNIKLTYINPDQLPQQHSISVFVLGKQSEAEKEYKNTTAPIKSTIKKLDTFKRKPSISIECAIENKEYKIGEIVKIGINSKILSAKGYVCIAKEKVVLELIPITLVDGQTVCEFRIEEKHSFHPLVFVYLEGSILIEVNDGAQKVTRLTSSFESVPLRIDYSDKRLNVQVEQCKKFQQPAMESSIIIGVKDNNNAHSIPNAFVTLMIVDQAVLDITSHRISEKWDPLDLFYSNTSNPFFIGRDKLNSLMDRTLFIDPEEIVEMELDQDDQDELQEIKIQYLGGRIIQLKVNSETTIAQVQEMIKERDGLPSSSQRLFYLNKQIDAVPTMKLKELSIANQETLNLVIRLHGGASTPANALDKPDPAQDLKKPIRVRSNFNPLAFFGTGKTDDYGKVTFNYKLPDNLSQFKVMAMVHDKNNRFGCVEHSFISTLPINIRPSPPRFLNHLDQATFPIMISSIVDVDLLFDGAITSSNCNIKTKGFKGILPAKSRILFPVTMEALVSNCTASFQFVARTQFIDEEITDAVSFKFPIYSSSVMEATTINHQLTNYTESNEASSHPMKFDNWKSLDQELGGLTITLSTSKLQKISCCVSYLLHYEYSCSEQLSSKLMGLFAAIKYPSLLDLDDIEKLNLDKVLNGGDKKPITDMFEILKKRQTSNHSFTYYDGSDSGVYEFVSLYVYWVLHQISDILDESQNKFVSESANAYFKSNADIFVFKKKEYEKSKFQYLLGKAFACFVYGSIKQMSPENDFVSKILDKAKKDLSDAQYSEIFIYLSQFLKTHPDFKKLSNYLTVTSGMAYVNTTPINAFSGSRCNAVLIFSLLELPNQHPLLDRLVTGLSHFANSDGRYSSTQSNAFNISAIIAYEKKKKQLDIDGTTKVNLFLNNHYIDKQNISIDDLNNYSISVPFSTVLKNQSPLIIERVSKGPLYYTLNLSYGSLNPISKAVNNRGLCITRQFKPVSNPADVVENLTSNCDEKQPNVEIKAGSRIKVCLRIKVDQISNFVVIKDRLPAGLESLQSKSVPYVYNGYWMNHVNNRENGVEIYSNLLYPGNYNYTYYVVAITPGLFVSPSAKIEEMYTPGTFGRSKSDVVLIK